MTRYTYTQSAPSGQNPQAPEETLAHSSSMSSTFNILMYSHDTYGLGHIRRTMAIASHLLEEKVNILILTGSPIVGRFDFPRGIDFVRIPGMIKKTNNLYLPHSIKIDVQSAMDIRKKIIIATAKAFEPGMFIVDKAPLGLKREILPTLKWLRKHRPETRVVLGLRDIMDDAEATKKEWRDKKVYDVLEKLYSEIWVYGDPAFYDPREEYDMPQAIRDKMVFTGYIPRRVPAKEHSSRLRREQRLGKKDKLVVVTTGGGGDGYPLLDAYLSMVEKNGGYPYRTILVGGPFLPRDRSDELAERARALNIRYHTFFKRMEKILAAADLVVSMGGYNTVCEVLSLKKPSLIIPRHRPRKEQLIRARILKEKGLADYLRWDELEPDALRAKIFGLMENLDPYLEKLDAFTMPGLDVMQERKTTLMELRHG